MSVNLVRAEALEGTVPYASASLTTPGSLAFTAGACPLDVAGRVVAPGHVAARAGRVMANLVAALPVDQS